MTPTITHHPAVMKEVEPAHVTLKLSLDAAAALDALLRHVQCNVLNTYGLIDLIGKLDPQNSLYAKNYYDGAISLMLVRREQAK